MVSKYREEKGNGSLKINEKKTMWKRKVENSELFNASQLEMIEKSNVISFEDEQNLM